MFPDVSGASAGSGAASSSRTSIVLPPPGTSSSPHWNPTLQPILANWTPPPIVNIAEGLPFSSAEDVPSEPLPANFAPAESAIVIDNGTAELRAGYASQVRTSSGWSGRPAVATDNVVSKYKDRKKSASYLLAGRDAYIDAQSRGAIRTAFERDVVTSVDVLEHVLDYAFLKMGISSEDGIHRPVVMTETLCNPAYSRGQVMELMMETYNASSVAFGLDSLFAAYANDVKEGIVVSSGKTSTTVVPLVGGRGILANSKRLNWGGALATDYLLRLIQLKYPGFPLRVTPSQATFMTHDLTYVYAGDSYEEHVRRLSHPDELAKEDRIVQFPFTAEEKSEKTAEELEAIAERKRESGRRLQEQAQRIRLEKLVQKENDLQYYNQLKEWKAKERKGEYLKRLESEGFETEQELDSTIRKIEAALKRSRARELGEEDESVAAEPPTFPLLEVPDHQLDEDGIKEKRKQRLMKAGYDARQRAKAEKEEERRAKEEELKRDEDERLSDPRGWAKKLRREYEDAIGKIKERKRLKEMLSDRKSLAAQQRMKNITQLASDEPEGGKRKRRKGNEDDGFGKDDSDWAVYKEIRADDSEDEEEEGAQLEALEARLRAHDPSFTESDTWSYRQAVQTKLTSTFLRGYWPHWDPESAHQAHQIHLNVERARVPEVLWQPNMAGVDQAGVDELCALVLSNYDYETRRRLAQSIFVTGQHTRYAGFDERLRRSVQATQPFDVGVKVIRAQDVRFDAWRGMARWALEEVEELRRCAVSRDEWIEKGAEYIKEHRFAASM